MKRTSFCFMMNSWECVVGGVVMARRALYPPIDMLLGQRECGFTEYDLRHGLGLQHLRTSY